MYAGTNLPTIMISNSEACFLILVQMSIANMVLLLLKMEVREDMSAAIITASIIPRAPINTKRMEVLYKTGIMKGKQMLDAYTWHIIYIGDFLLL